MKLPNDSPLTDEDRNFLQSIYVPALPGNQSLVDMSAFDAEKIQGYAIVFKLIDGKGKLKALCIYSRIPFSRIFNFFKLL